MVDRGAEGENRHWRDAEAGGGRKGRERVFLQPPDLFAVYAQDNEYVDEELFRHVVRGYQVAGRRRSDLT